jgi:hypothetical protein
MAESRAVFIEALARPERLPVSEKMRKWGIQQDSDFERNVGAYLGRIAEEVE